MTDMSRKHDPESLSIKEEPDSETQSLDVTSADDLSSEDDQNFSGGPLVVRSVSEEEKDQELPLMSLQPENSSPEHLSFKELNLDTNSNTSLELQSGISPQSGDEENSLQSTSPISSDAAGVSEGVTPLAKKTLDQWNFEKTEYKEELGESNVTDALQFSFFFEEGLHFSNEQRPNTSGEKLNIYPSWIVDNSTKREEVDERDKQSRILSGDHGMNAIDPNSVSYVTTEIEDNVFATATADEKLTPSSSDLRRCGPTTEELDEADHDMTSHPGQNNNGPGLLQDSSGKVTVRAFTMEPINQVCPEACAEDTDQSLDLTLRSALSSIPLDLTAAISQMQVSHVATTVQTSRACTAAQENRVPVHSEEDYQSLQSVERTHRPKVAPLKVKPPYKQARSAPVLHSLEQSDGTTSLHRRTSAPPTSCIGSNANTYCSLCESTIPSATDPDNLKWRYSVYNQIFINAEKKFVHIVFWIKDKDLSQYSENKGFCRCPLGDPELLRACVGDRIHYRIETTSEDFYLSGAESKCFRVSLLGLKSQQFQLHVIPRSKMNTGGPIFLRYYVHGSSWHEMELHPRISYVGNLKDPGLTIPSSRLPMPPQGDTADGPQDYVIYNQLFIDENTLCIECVFWRGQSDFATDFTKGSKRPRKPFHLNVSPAKAICFRFTTNKDDSAYRVNKEGEHKLSASYFKDHPYKIYSFRVERGSAEFKCENINVDYHVEDDLSPQNVPLRIKNCKQAEEAFEASQNGGTHVTLNFTQGEWSNTIKNLVTGGLLKETNERTESHFVSGKNK